MPTCWFGIVGECLLLHACCVVHDYWCMHDFVSAYVGACILLLACCSECVGAFVFIISVFVDLFVHLGAFLFTCVRQ